MTGGMSFEDVMDLAEGMDLPDGAFWAMAHELSGLDYGEGFPLIAPKPEKPHRCGTCGKGFATKGAKRRHRIGAHKVAPESGS